MPETKELRPLMESIEEMLKALEKVQLPSLIEGHAVKELRRQYTEFFPFCMRAHVIPYEREEKK